MKRFCIYSLAATIVVLSGCGPSTNFVVPEETVEELMADWNAIAAQPFSQMDINSAQQISNKLAMKEGGIETLLDVLADPASTPQAKILVVMTLDGRLKAEFEPRLAEFTQTGLDSTTRACAIQLLSGIDSDFSRKHLRELLNDESHQVKLAALIGLLQKGESESIIDDIESIWSAPETRGEDIVRLMMVLPDEYAFEHVQHYVDVLLGVNEFPAEARAIAVGVLQRTQDLKWRDTLEKAANDDPDEQVKALSKQALQLMDLLHEGAEPSVVEEP